MTAIYEDQTRDEGDDGASCDSSKATSTSACVLDLTSSGGSEIAAEVSSSSNDKVKVEVESLEASDRALNLSLSPQVRLARLERLEQMMPEDLTSMAVPQDLSTSGAGQGRGSRQPEMPMDLTVRMAAPQPMQEFACVDEEIADDSTPMPPLGGAASVSASEGLLRVDSLDPQSMKDTLLSCTDPSSSHLDMDVSAEEASLLELNPNPPEQADSASGLGVDTEGELVDFSLEAVDFEDLQDIVEEHATAAESVEAETVSTADIFPQTLADDVSLL